MKRDRAAILGLLKRRPRCGGGDATEAITGRPRCGGGQTDEEASGGEAPPSKVSSGAGRRLRSRSFWTCPSRAAVDRHVREQVDRDGFVVVEDALEPAAVERLTAAVERV